MTIATRLLDALRRDGMTLACAESMSGGLFGARLTEPPGASEVFAGGVVVYTDAAKVELAGVDRKLLEREGGVSAPVARELATGTRERLGVDIAVSIVGFAGPSVPLGGDVGQIYVGVAHWGGVEVHALHLAGDRAQLRSAAVDEALRFVLDAVEKAAKARA